MKKGELLEILEKLEKIFLERVVSTNLERFQSILEYAKDHINLEMEECKKDYVECDVKKNFTEKIKTVEDFTNCLIYNPLNQSFSVQLYNLNKKNKEGSNILSSTYYLNLAIAREKNNYELNLSLEKIVLLRDNECYTLYDECSHAWDITLLEEKLKTDDETKKILKYYLNLYNKLYRNLMLELY